jgi:predicted nucleic acid-binding protein
LIAFDTNILVYAQQDTDENNKHSTAKSLLKKFGIEGGIIPVQVLSEFLNVCKNKLKIAPLDAIGQVQDYQEIFDCPLSLVDDLTGAAILAEQHKLSYFDALIVTIACRAGATVLLSEDMHDGLEVEGLRIINPFATANEALLADYFGSAV